MILFTTLIGSVCEGTMDLFEAELFRCIKCVQRGLRCYELSDVCIRQGVTADWGSGHMHGIISQHMNAISDLTIIFRRKMWCLLAQLSRRLRLGNGAGMFPHTSFPHISPWFVFLKIFGMNSKHCQGRLLRRPMVFNNEPEAIIRLCFLLLCAQFAFLRQLLLLLIV